MDTLVQIDMDGYVFQTPRHHRVDWNLLVPVMPGDAQELHELRGFHEGGEVCRFSFSKNSDEKKRDC